MKDTTLRSHHALPILGYVGRPCQSFWGRSNLAGKAAYLCMALSIITLLNVVTGLPFGAVAVIFLFNFDTRRKLYHWANADGSNLHSFDLRAPTPMLQWPFPTPTAGIEPDIAFRTAELHDPNVGPIKLDFDKFRYRANSAGRLVFHVKLIEHRGETPPEALQSRWTRFQYVVRADPGLHPDTVEELVHRVALLQDDNAYAAYLKKVPEPGRPAKLELA